jgi:hypothetical protein
MEKKTCLLKIFHSSIVVFPKFRNLDDKVWIDCRVMFYDRNKKRGKEERRMYENPDDVQEVYIPASKKIGCRH